MLPDDLVRLANVIKSTKPSPTLRNTVVSFYLPSMPPDLRPWASVDLAPVAKVVIGGLKLEEQQAYAAEANTDRRALIGSWLTDLPSTPGRMAVFKDKGKTYLEWEMRTGQKTVDEIVVTRGTRGSRFDLKAGGDDYYLLKATGELELRSKDRLTAVAERISLTKDAPVAVSLPVYAPASSEVAHAPIPGLGELGQPVDQQVEVLAPAPVRKKRVVRREAPTKKVASEGLQIDYMNQRYAR